MAEENTGPLATMFGTYYPKGFLVAVVETEEVASRAVEALHQAGWAGDEARAFTGDFVVAHHEEYISRRNPLESLASAFASDERVALEQYIDLARAGHHFVTVHAPAAEQADRAGEILAGLGAFAMRHYGEATFREITTRKD
jgi:hypothetical protein